MGGKKESKPDSQHNLTKYRDLIKDCENLVLVLLTTQLSELFDQIRPTLMDFSDKAETNAKQRLFYDAISQVQRSQGEVEYIFREEISRGFHEFSHGHPVHYKEKAVDIDDDIPLSIVENQELEENIALERFISKAQNQWYQELYALGKRMSLVRGGLELPIDDIPGGPAHIMSAFQAAAREFNFDITILLIIYALFDKFVLRGADNLYESYNAKLVEAGIFPNLKFSVAKKPDTYHSSAQSHPDDADPDGLGQEFDPLTESIPSHPMGSGHEAGAFNPYSSSYDLSAKPAGQVSAGSSSIAIGEEIFQSIRSLLSERRRADPAFRNHPEINPAITGVVMAEKPEIVAALSGIQPDSGTAYIPGFEDSEVEPDDIEIDHNLLDNIRQTLVTERNKLYHDIDRNTIPTADLDTIELVGMLFEHVLNDEELPNIIKALISHLHTPYLKIAIIDSSFLIDGEHTARVLLNLMVEAGKHWVDEDNLRIGLYHPLKEIVDTVLQDFSDDLTVIDQVREKLTQQIEDFRQKAKIVEERTKEAAKGRDRLESARSKANKIVNAKIAERDINPIVKRFLSSAWLDKMILMMLRNPEIEKTPEWSEVVSVIDTITWVCDAKEKPTKGKQLTDKISKLKQDIENGLSSLGDYHRPDSQALFKLLDSFQTGQPLDTTAIDDKAVSESRFGKVKPVEEEPIIITPKEQKIADKLASVEFGTWFEIADKDKQPRQLKLSWYSPVTKKYMFVDRSGVQAVVISSNELVRHISNRTAKIIKPSQTPFVDNALNTIKSMLTRTFGLNQPNFEKG